MNILFLIFHGFSESSGISKKIQYQIKGLEELNHKVDVCTYSINEEGHRVRMVNNQIIHDYGTGHLAAINKRINYNSIYDYAISHSIQFIYVRSFHNANPFTIKLFRKLKQAGIRIALEIPTYPYDQEYEGFSFITRMGIQIDKLYRKQLAKHVNAIITFSNYKTIFGQHTICISNGVDFDNIPLKEKTSHTEKEFHLIGVAEIHYWHGYDRLIHGLGKYYQKPHKQKVIFHIVGGIGPSEMHNSSHASGFYELIKKYNLEDYIIMHGQKYGKELNELFNHADFAVGSLARHRSGITNLKALKNREYAVRGIPFIYSEVDEDFDKMPYVLKASADESPIDIEKIIYFYRSKQQWEPKQIRKTIKHLSWKEQMNKVINNIFQ